MEIINSKAQSNMPPVGPQPAKHRAQPPAAAASTVDSRIKAGSTILSPAAVNALATQSARPEKISQTNHTDAKTQYPADLVPSEDWEPLSISMVRPSCPSEESGTCDYASESSSEASPKFNIPQPRVQTKMNDMKEADISNSQRLQRYLARNQERSQKSQAELPTESKENRLDAIVTALLELPESDALSNMRAFRKAIEQRLRQAADVDYYADEFTYTLEKLRKEGRREFVAIVEAAEDTLDMIEAHGDAKPAFQKQQVMKLFDVVEKECKQIGVRVFLEDRHRYRFDLASFLGNLRQSSVSLLATMAWCSRLGLEILSLVLGLIVMAVLMVVIATVVFWIVPSPWVSKSHA